MTEEPRRPEGLPDFRALPWDDLYPRLLIAARGKLKRLFWRGERRGQVPGGRTEHDFVQTAVQKLLAGERRWNPDKTAFENLWGAASGEIINCATGAENKTTSRADDKVVALRDGLPTPEAHALWRREHELLLRHLRAMGGKVAEMAELMLVEGLNGPELAEAMGLERHEADALKKRLKRAVAGYLESAREVERRAAE